MAELLNPIYIKIEPSVKQQILKGDIFKYSQTISTLSSKDTHLVACNVESASEFSLLWDVNIRYFQGYYVQQPIDKPELLIEQIDE